MSLSILKIVILSVMHHHSMSPYLRCIKQCQQFDCVLAFNEKSHAKSKYNTSEQRGEPV